MASGNSGACVIYSESNSEQHFVRTIALQHACLPCLLHANRPMQPMRVSRVSDGCSSCTRRLSIPHAINIQNHKTHWNYLQHGAWNDCVSLVMHCLSIFRETQRHRWDLAVLLFSRFYYALLREGHKFMCDLRYFFFFLRCFSDSAKACTSGLICNANLCLGVSFSVDCCLSPCDGLVLNWLKTFKNHPLTVNGLKQYNRIELNRIEDWWIQLDRKTNTKVPELLCLAVEISQSDVHFFGYWSDMSQKKTKTFRIM